MPCDGPFRILLCNENIGQDFIVVRNHKTKIPGIVIGSHHLRKPMGQNGGNLCLLPLPVLGFQKRNLHLIHMKGMVYPALGNI